MPLFRPIQIGIRLLLCEWPVFENAIKHLEIARGALCRALLYLIPVREYALYTGTMRGAF